MKVVIDSSAFAKRYIEETGSENLVSILQDTTQLGLCSILVPEIISGMSRRVREKHISVLEYQTIKQTLLNDIRDATILQITPAVLSQTIQLLESNVLRTLDALHIACAVEWQSELFVTSDKRQWKAAKHSGIKSKFIG